MKKRSESGTVGKRLVLIAIPHLKFDFATLRSASTLDVSLEHITLEDGRFS